MSANHHDRSQTTPLYCSFCGKSDAEVSVMIDGPSVFICNECVDVCCDIIAAKTAKKVENHG